MTNLENVQVLEAVGCSVIAYMVDGTHHEVRKFDRHDDAVDFIRNLHHLLGKTPWK